MQLQYLLLCIQYTQIICFKSALYVFLFYLCYKCSRAVSLLPFLWETTNHILGKECRYTLSAISTISLFCNAWKKYQWKSKSNVGCIGTYLSSIFRKRELQGHKVLPLNVSRHTQEAYPHWFMWVFVGLCGYVIGLLLAYLFLTGLWTYCTPCVITCDIWESGTKFLFSYVPILSLDLPSLVLII